MMGPQCKIITVWHDEHFTLFLLEKNSPLQLVVHLNLVLTKNNFNLFSEKSCHMIDSRIVITWHNVYLTPI